MEDQVDQLKKQSNLVSNKAEIRSFFCVCVTEIFIKELVIFTVTAISRV